MDGVALSKIRIVLVEPAGARNVGSIARVMKNMGLHRLVLVKPQCDPLGEEARQMAVHAADVLESAQVVSSLLEAIQGCHRTIATTDRARHRATPLESARLTLPWLLETGSSEETNALIFGPEDRGLSNDELDLAQRWVGIPTSPVYSSMNLAQAVAVCCYELRQAVLPAEPIPPLQENETPASVAALEGYYQHLEQVLLQIGYLHPHTVTSRMQKFRHFYNRAMPSEQELAMLRGILRQIEWAAGVDRRLDETAQTPVQPGDTAP